MWETPTVLLEQCEQSLAQAKIMRKKISDLGSADRNLNNTLRPYNQLLISLDTARGLTELMASVHPDQKTREAAESCQQKISKFVTSMGLDRSLFDGVAAVDTADLPPQTQRFAKHLLRDFRRAGVDKDESTRKRLAEINQELVKLSQTYGKNVRNDVRSIQLTSPEQLDGLPEDYKSAHKADKNGNIAITTDYPDFFPFQNYAQDSNLRKQLYQAFLQRGYPANKPILQKVLMLRAEYAKILGHPSWASYNAEDKMVGSAEKIDEFIRSLNKIVRKRSQRDLEVILKRKRKDLPNAKDVEVWDRFFYTGKVRTEQYDFDSRTVRPYFSYPRVKKGIFDLYGELFGVQFVPIRDEAVWSPSVEAYAMKSGKKTLGKFYLDMHPRKGKYKHAAMFPVQTGLEDGRTPIASLVCNFPDPSKGDGKALMEHNQVVTFFHEFGHLIHHLLAQGSNWVTLSGINVEWDFVEAPSQLLEEWAWDPVVLARFAKHIDNDQPISRSSVQKMRRASEFGKGIHVMRQLFYTAYSFYLHNTDPTDLDLEAFSRTMYDSYSPYPPIEEGHVYASFGHLIGYSSMYYTYQWSLVIAKDLFTRFSSEGLMSAATARDYRDTILAPGGTRDAAKLVESFLGRKYNLEAYRAWLEQN
jgi:thimet oligopeptidase